MAVTKLYVPQMTLAVPATLNAYLSTRDQDTLGNRAFDYNLDVWCDTDEDPYLQIKWDIDPDSGVSATARFTWDFAGMVVLNPSIFPEVGADWRMNVRGFDHDFDADETLHATKLYSDNAADEPVFIIDFGTPTNQRGVMLELDQTAGSTSLVHRIAMVMAGTTFEIDAYPNRNTADTRRAYNDTVPIDRGRQFSLSRRSNTGKVIERRYEMIDDDDMQALRDAWALARGSRVPFIWSDDLSGADEGMLVRFAPELDRIGLREERMGNGIWRATVVVEQVPYILEGANH